jgi:aminobutyraldehyde dehydrogenase
MQTGMLIGADFVTGAGEAETILNPKTGAAVATVAEASPEQIDEAVAAAANAFATWSRTTPAERAALLLKLADRI